MLSQTRPPAFPEIGVAALVIEPWSDRFQPRHQIMSRLARYFHVVWVNPVHDWNRGLQAWRERRAYAHKAPTAYPGFEVYVPEPWLPRLSRFESLANWTFDRRLEHARDLLLRRGCRHTVLHIWNPEFARALDRKLFDRTVYHVDDEYSYSKVETAIGEDEAHLLKSADQVFMVSHSLMERKGHFNPHTDFLPNGVNYEYFSKPVEEPEDLKSIPHPRVGFSGYLTRHLDWPLLRWLAGHRPDINFVFVGAQKKRVEVANAVAEMRQLPNVHFLGAKPWWELSRYPQHFDACLMPYEISYFTSYIYPLKLHEYLASGQPVVGSRISSLLEFDGLLRLPANKEQWSRAIDDALAPESRSREARDARQSTAEKHDWEILTMQVAVRLAERSGHVEAARSIEAELAKAVAQEHLCGRP